MFAYYFSDYSKTGEMGPSGAQSDITFGYYDKEKFEGEMRWYPVTYKSMFAINLDDIKVNGKSTGACKVVKECRIILDSGTSHMSMPGKGLRNFVKQGIPTYFEKRKCDNQKSWGDLTFVIGGHDYTLPNDDWLYEPKPLSSLA